MNVYYEHTTQYRINNSLPDEINTPASVLANGSEHRLKDLGSIINEAPK